jgi:carbonic anhydrase/acetyltransferase-like protein (isoleucine patch superfamily)
VIEAFAGKTARVDERAFVHPRAVLIGDIEIGAESSVWPNVTLRGDDGPIVIGTQTSIQDNSVVHCTEGLSRTTIGSRVTVGHSVILHGCSIHDDCLIGMGSVLLDNAIIETGAFVAAGTLIPPNKVVRAGTMVRGNPMEVVRECSQRDHAMIEFSWRAYVRRTAQYLAERDAALAAK